MQTRRPDGAHGRKAGEDLVARAALDRLRDREGLDRRLIGALLQGLCGQSAGDGPLPPVVNDRFEEATAATRRHRLAMPPS